jgi:hypothetical protein
MKYKKVELEKIGAIDGIDIYTSGIGILTSWDGVKFQDFVIKNKQKILKMRKDAKSRAKSKTV